MVLAPGTGQWGGCLISSKAERSARTAVSPRRNAPSVQIHVASGRWPLKWSDLSGNRKKPLRGQAGGLGALENLSPSRHDHTASAGRPRHGCRRLSGSAPPLENPKVRRGAIFVSSSSHSPSALPLRHRDLHRPLLTSGAHHFLEVRPCLIRSPVCRRAICAPPEAARFLGLSGRTLEKHRTYGTGPAYRKLGGRVVYSLEDLQDWANRGAVTSTSDPSGRVASSKAP